MSPTHKSWTDRILVLAALGLLAAVLATGESITTSEVLRRRNNVFVGWRQDDVSRIAVETQEQRLSLERRQEHGETKWIMSGAKDAGASADAAAVDQLLQQLRFASWERKLEAESVDRSALGLAKPRATLELSMGEMRYRALLGKSAAAPAGAAYLELTGAGIQGKAVGIVGDQLVEALLADQRRFVGLNLVHWARSQIERVELGGAGGARRFERAGHRFRFDGMQHDRLLNGSTLDPFFYHLARLRLEPFLSREQARTALEQGEQVTIALWGDGSKTPLELLVGGRCPSDEARIVALRKTPRPIAGCVSQDVMAGLTLPAGALVDATPFGFPPDAVERVVIERGSARLELVRHEDAFRLKAPVDTEVALGLGNRRLETLVESSGEFLENPELAALGLEPPAGKATVTGLSDFDDAAVEETVELGKVDEQGRLPIRRPEDGVTLLLTPQAARAFRVDATLSKSLTLFDFAEQDLVAIRVRSGELSQHLVRTGGQLGLEAPAGFEADASLVSALVSALGKLRAERWVSDSDDGVYGLEKPSVEVVLEVTANGGSKTMSLQIGDAVPGGAYAKLSGVEGVFVLSSPALRSITTPVLSRAAFVVHPEKLERIELTTRERSVALEARGSTWVSMDPGVDGAHAERIVEALENLRPDFAVHTGPPAANEGFAFPTLRVTLTPSEPSPEPLELLVGSAHSFRDLSGYFARAEGSDASFALSQGRVQALLDLL